MTSKTTIVQSRAKAAVLKLLSLGEITPPEAAWAIGTSRQNIHNWMRLEGIEPHNARWDYVRERVAREYASAIEPLPRIAKQ